MSKVQSEVRIRSVEELTGSHQVSHLLAGRFQTPEGSGSGKIRSAMLAQRRVDDWRSAKDAAEQWEDPRATLSRSATEGVMATCVALPFATKKISNNTSTSSSSSSSSSSSPGDASRPQTTAICGAPRRSGSAAASSKLEVIRDRPGAPTLGWREEQRTQQDMLAERTEAATAHREAALLRARPATRVRTQRPRVEGPLSHLQTFAHDFGKATKKQFPGSQTSSTLFSERRRDMKQGNDRIKAETEARKADRLSVVTGPLLASQQPWWKLHKEPAQLAAADAKRASLASAFQQRVHDVTQHPASSGEYKAEELARKRQLRGIARSVTNRPRSTLRVEDGDAEPRQARRNRFTDAVIEFRNTSVPPSLTPTGKKLRYDPGETNQLFSSFTRDGVFLERLERIRVDAAHRAAEVKRKHGDKVPRRSFAIARSASTPSLALLGGRRGDGAGGHGPAARLGGQCDPVLVRSGGFQRLQSSN